MKIRSMLGLSAIGAAYYAHRRRGGELTLDSVRDSVNALGQWAKDKMASATDKLSAAKGDVGKASTTGMVEPTDAEEVFPTTTGFTSGDRR